MKNWYVNLVMETSESSETDEQHTCVISAPDEESAKSKARTDALSKGLKAMKTYCWFIAEVPEKFELT